ncbi:MAG: S1 family peptidase [Alphaproteobacteria bacterium]|nr:S1 family peptidase [Alphaproteobacteria bacterium]
MREMLLIRKIICSDKLKIPGLLRRSAPRNDEGVIASEAWRCRKLSTFFNLLFCLLITSFPSVAMVSDGAHGEQSYIKLAKEKSSFESACSVHDSKTSISQTGVLIAPNVVATAAHGIASILAKTNSTLKSPTTIVPVSDLTVTFDTNGWCSVYQAESVLIDSRYLNNLPGVEAKYDIAFIKLKEDVRGIEPAKVFTNAEVPLNSPLHVVTFGNADLSKNSLLKRAFKLYEMDAYFSHPFDEEALALNRSVLVSSLFFKPDEALKKPSLSSDEVTIRTYEATQNWLKDGKGPYALALPGTSGAPVFVTLMVNGRKQDYLFGIITSFAHLSGRHQAPKGQPEYQYILENREKVFGQYQTIFALFYEEDNLYSKANSKRYRRDKYLSSLLLKIQGGI